MEITPDNRSNEGKNNSSEWYEWILLFYLLQSNYQNEALWDEFENGLIFKSRFSSHSDILNEIHKRSQDVAFTISKGKQLFRARKYKNSPYDKIVGEFLKNDNITEDKIEQELKQLHGAPEAFSRLLFPDLYSASKEFPITINSPVKTAFEHWEKAQFKGFDSKGSGAPEPDKVRAGRANPDFIRYLYLAEEADTACYEVRPIIGQYVSVATFSVVKDLRLYDLTCCFPTKSGYPEYEVPSLFDCISEHFSIPNDDEPQKYIPTQFITEKIKEMGFDGIRFRSSLKKDGVNIVVFEPENCEAISSDLVQIGKIQMDIRPFNLYPQKLEEDK